MSAPRIALALGSGSARGWAHIGILRELDAEGVKVDVVAGTSIGALVGAAYVAGELDKLEDWVTRMGWSEVLGLFDPGWSGGLLKGDKLMSYFGKHFTNADIRTLPKTFGCVATDLANGREIWLREGSVVDAIRASIAMPGLFSPVRSNGTFLVDGALVNPVPVSLAHAMGGEMIIGVDLGSGLIGRRFRTLPVDGAARSDVVKTESVAPDEDDVELEAPASRRWFDALRRMLPGTGNGGGRDTEQRGLPLPTLLDVMNTSINIMQVRVARSRLAGEPADVLIQPRLAHIGLLEYHRAGEAIAEGRAAAKLAMPAIRRLLDMW